MGREFEIRTVRELRVVMAPARRAIFESMLLGPMTAGEVGERCGLSAASAHYHLGQLAAIGLVRECGERATGARPEKVFALTADRLELKRGRRGPAYVRELARGVGRLLRLAGREFESAWRRPSAGMRPRVVRVLGWLTEEELAELDRLEGELRALLEGSAGVGERVAVTVVMSPVDA